MINRKEFSPTGRNIIMIAGVVSAFTLAEPLMTTAHASSPAVTQVSASGDATDLSARRRVRRHYRGNPAAGLAIMGAMIGTFGAIAARQHDDYYYYGPGYYDGPPPVYYAPRPYYGPYPYYGPRAYRYYPY